MPKENQVEILANVLLGLALLILEPHMSQVGMF
jgi:hypothetical protein